MNTPIDAARAYLEGDDGHLSHMADGDFQVDTHNSELDCHVVNQLPDVDESHIDKSPYNVVTVTKDIILGDGTIISKVVKLEVDNKNNVKNVLESK